MQLFNVLTLSHKLYARSTDRLPVLQDAPGAQIFRLSEMLQTCQQDLTVYSIRIWSKRFCMYLF